MFEVAPAKLATYTAVYRLGARPYALAMTFGGAGRVQLATIHHGVAAIRKVKLRQVLAGIESSSVGGISVLELIRITTAPVTGNPTITPNPLDPGDWTAEATCLALPTTQATEAGPPIGAAEWNLGATGAVPTTNPPPGLGWVDLIAPAVASQNDGTERFPTIRPGVLEGFAVTCDASAC